MCSGYSTARWGKNRKYIGTGESPFDDNLFVVLDESKNLERFKADASALVSS